MKEIGKPFHRLLSNSIKIHDQIKEEIMSAHVFVDQVMYWIKLVEGNVLKIYEIKFRNNLDYKTYELNDITLPCDDGYVNKWMSVSELNGFVYLFTISYDHRHSNGEKVDKTKRQEQVYRLKIIKEDEREMECEILYKSIAQDFVRIESPLIADSQRNCFYWFAGMTINGGTLKNCIKFNVDTCEWEELTNFTMGFVLHTHSSLFWKNRYVIIFGGFVSSCYVTANIIAFDIESGRWYSIYSVDDCDENLIPSCYPRYNSGISLVSNKWASDFDKTIPYNDGTDTLFIYGGYIEHLMDYTHEVLLFYLDESTFKPGEVENLARIPFSLTNYCTPEEWKTSRIDEEQTEVLNNDRVYKILPTNSRNAIRNITNNFGKESLFILDLNYEQDIKITKVDLNDDSSIFSNRKQKYWDISIVHKNLNA